MGQHCPDTSLFGNQDRSANSILQKAKADALPLILFRDRESRQDHHRHRVLPHPLTDPLRRFQRIDLANRQTKVASDAVLLRDDESLGRAAALCLPGMAQEPVVQRWPATVKTIQPVARGQRFRCAYGHFASQGALRANRSRIPSLTCSGRSSRSMKA